MLDACILKDVSGNDWDFLSFKLTSVCFDVTCYQVREVGVVCFVRASQLFQVNSGGSFLVSLWLQ